MIKEMPMKIELFEPIIQIGQIGIVLLGHSIKELKQWIRERKVKKLSTGKMISDMGEDDDLYMGGLFLGLYCDSICIANNIR